MGSKRPATATLTAGKLTAGKQKEAIHHYGKAWEQAVHMKLSRPARLANGHLQWEFFDLPNRTYIVQISTNLVDWVTIGPRNTDADGALLFEETGPVAPRSRYYRVVAP